MRCSHIVPAVLRETTTDALVLGRRIPKNTHLWFFSSAQSFLRPAFDIKEDLRAESSRQAKGRWGVWDPEGIDQFIPERWLRKEKNQEGDEILEKEVFDPHSGPQLAFGAGPRACFGQKLSYMEMRIVVTMLIWSFEFMSLGENLNNLKAVDVFMLRPKACYVKLKQLHF